MKNDFKNVNRREFVLTSGAVLGTLASTTRGAQPAPGKNQAGHCRDRVPRYRHVGFSSGSGLFRQD